LKINKLISILIYLSGEKMKIIKCGGAVLKEKNDRLVNANANLLQRVPIAESDSKKETVKEESKKRLSLEDCFDEKGNFKR
jgi:hypothetical protein